MFAIGCILLLAAVPMYISADDGGAIAYTEEMFNENIAKNPHFIKFYAPWCGHCKRMAPAWEELGKKFNVQDAKVTVAKVDCTVETKLCSAQGVKGYPTVKWFANGDEGEKYSGGRDLGELTKFVELSLAVGDGDEAEAGGDDAAAERVEGVFALTSANFKSHIAKGHHFIKFFAPWCGHCKAMAPTWIELGKENEKDSEAKVTINEVDCTSQQDVCKEHGVRGYPTIMWFSDGKMIEKYSGGRDKNSFETYMKKMTSQKVGSDSEEEKIPDKKTEAKTEDAKSALQVLTGDSFEAAIKEGTTFVKFYAPWCGHCKKLAPTWEELAQKFADNDKVNIAKVDCTVEKDLCKSHEVRGYPTLILFQNGEKSNYAGQRTMKGFEDFIKSKAPRDEL